MTIRERLLGLLSDNGIRESDLTRNDIDILYDGNFDPSCEVILEMNSRINALEKRMYQFSNDIDVLERRRR